MYSYFTYFINKILYYAVSKVDCYSLLLQGGILHASHELRPFSDLLCAPISIVIIPDILIHPAESVANTKE
jgi:hypothetical protein